MKTEHIYKGVRLYNGVGTSLCLILMGLFVFSYSLSYYQLDYWQNYFFAGTLDAGTHCEARAVGLEDANWVKANVAISDQSWQKITLPHPGNPIVGQDKTSAWQYLNYRCSMTLPMPIPDIKYLHTGWIFSQFARVHVGKDLKFDMALHGGHKSIIPINPEDLDGNIVRFTIDVLAKSSEDAGLIGRGAIVVAPSDMTHTKLLSLGVSLQTVRYLYTFIPVLILGLILCYGWFRKVRSRMLLITLSYFAVAACKNALFVFSDLWPWNSDITYVLAEPFTLATGLILILLMAEGFGIWSRSILVPLGTIGFALLATFLVLLSLPSVYDLYALLNHAKILIILAGGYLAWHGYRKGFHAQSNPDWNRSYFYVLVAITGTFWLITILDYIFYVTSAPLRFSYKFEYILPLAVGYTLVQNLLQINMRYERERKEREKIEQDLQLAREIQDSIAPPEVSTLFEKFRIHCYQIKHDKVAGDWMAIRATSGGVLAIVADATGKGVQAALVIHAVQSLWAAELDHDYLDVVTWLQKVNRTLLTLGKTRPHSLTVGVFLLGPSDLTYWSAGHLPLYVSFDNEEGKRQLKSLNARGNIVGIKPDLALTSETVCIKDLNNIALLLGTDGVFEKGTRSGRREILNLFTLLGSEGEGALHKMTTADDRTVILLTEQDVDVKAA